MTLNTINNRIAQLHQLIEVAQDDATLAELDNELEVLELAVIEMESND